MSFIHLESQKSQPHGKDEATRKRRSLTFAACLIGAALIFTFVVAGASHYTSLPGVAPRDTDLQLRPEYPVSAYIYERGFFRWFIGIAVIAGAGAAFSSFGPACVAAGPIGVGGCVLAGIAAIGVIASLANSHQQKTELKLMKQAMVYMEPVDHSTGKRGVNPTEQFLSEYYGVTDYRYHGRITGSDKFNKLLVDRNEGLHVPVFSFTSPQGIQFHHAAVYNDTDGSVFHRFGFATPSRVEKRTTIYAEYKDPVYFKSGGFDALDAGGIDNGNNQYLNTGDYKKMETELHCAIPNLGSTTELGIQTYDATTQETIGFASLGTIKADGSTNVFDHKFSPPLTKGDNCPKQSSTD